VSLLKIGECYLLSYPAANYVCARTRWEARRVRVLAVRDTQAEPLEAGTLLADPCLLRGRWLYRCWDLDKQAERSFWDCSISGPIELSASGQPLTYQCLRQSACNLHADFDNIPDAGEVPPSDEAGGLIANHCLRSGDDSSANGLQGVSMAELDVRSNATTEFPPLLVSIYRGKEFVRYAKIPDPREAFCRCVNGLNTGETAHPVSLATRLPNSKRRAE
jgi:hypothetical protein